MITKTIREALEAERVSLKAERDALTADIDARISAIDVLLRPTEVSQRQLPLTRPISTTEPISTINTGLRDAIPAIVVNHKGGISKTAILETLEAGGFEAKGTTPLSTLVTTELWRLARKEIRKVGDKYYPASENAVA